MYLFKCYILVFELDSQIFPPRDYSLGSAKAVLRNLRFVRVEHTDTSEESKSLQNFYGVKQEEMPALVFINGNTMFATFQPLYNTTAAVYVPLDRESEGE